MGFGEQVRDAFVMSWVSVKDMVGIVGLSERSGAPDVHESGCQDCVCISVMVTPTCVAVAACLYMYVCSPMHLGCRGITRVNNNPRHNPLDGIMRCWGLLCDPLNSVVNMHPSSVLFYFICGGRNPCRFSSSFLVLLWSHSVGQCSEVSRASPRDA